MTDRHDDRASRSGRDRAVSATTSKVLEIALVVLYVGLLSTALYAGAVPGYRSVAGDAVAERTLATASQRVQQAVPPNGSHVEATVRVDLPDAIRGRAYDVEVEGRRLVLDHPNPDVRAASRLALPESVVEVTGTWSSTRPARVVVRGTSRGLVVRLEEGRL